MRDSSALLNSSGRDLSSLNDFSALLSHLFLGDSNLLGSGLGSNRLLHLLLDDLSGASLDNGAILTNNRSGNSLGAPLAIESFSTELGRILMIGNMIVDTPAIKIDGGHLGLSFKRLNNSVFIAHDGTIRAFVVYDHVFVIIIGLDHLTVGIELSL